MGKLTKNLFQPWLDVMMGAAERPVFRRVDKSTQFELAYNPNTEDRDYIDQKSSSTELTGYQLELPQEIVLDNTNPMYAFLDRLFESMPVGSDCVVPFLLVKPDLSTGRPTRGLFWPRAEVHPDTLNTPDGLLSFNIELNGDFQVGTVEIEGGELSFSATAAATGIKVPPEDVAVQQGATAPSGCAPDGGDGYMLFSSSDPKTATVDADGTVRGVKAGAAKVDAVCITPSGRYTARFGVTVS